MDGWRNAALAYKNIKCAKGVASRPYAGECEGKLFARIVTRRGFLKFPHTGFSAVGGWGHRRLKRRNQAFLGIADQIGSSHTLQCLAQQRPVGGVVVAQESLVQFAFAGGLGDGDFLAGFGDFAQRVLAAVVHGSGHRHGGGGEGLYLVEAEVVALEP